LAASVNLVLKLSVIVSLLLASSGVGYYYAVYLPRRDAQLDSERAQDKARADAERKRADRERQVAEQKKSEQRQADTKAAEARYQSCVNSATTAHVTSWAVECKRLAEKAAADHAECLSKTRLSKGYCDTAYRMRDGSRNCTLPVKVAADLDGDLNNARNRCARERKAALQ
jgi:hypothetical protein